MYEVIRTENLPSTGERKIGLVKNNRWIPGLLLDKFISFYFYNASKNVKVHSMKTTKTNFQPSINN